MRFSLFTLLYLLFAAAVHLAVCNAFSHSDGPGGLALWSLIIGWFVLKAIRSREPPKMRATVIVSIPDPDQPCR
jgi:hypothetical protein